MNKKSIEIYSWIVTETKIDAANCRSMPGIEYQMMALNMIANNQKNELSRFTKWVESASVVGCFLSFFLPADGQDDHLVTGRNQHAENGEYRTQCGQQTAEKQRQHASAESTLNSRETNTWVNPLLILLLLLLPMCQSMHLRRVLPTLPKLARRRRVKVVLVRQI